MSDDDKNIDTTDSPYSNLGGGHADKDSVRDKQVVQDPAKWDMVSTSSYASVNVELTEDGNYLADAAKYEAQGTHPDKYPLENENTTKVNLGEVNNGPLTSREVFPTNRPNKFTDQLKGQGRDGGLYIPEKPTDGMGKGK